MFCREAREGHAHAQVQLLPREHGLRQVGVGLAEAPHRPRDVLRRHRRELGAANSRAAPQLRPADVDDLERDGLALAVAVEEQDQRVAAARGLAQVLEHAAGRRHAHDGRVPELGRVARVPVPVGLGEVQREAVAEHGRDAKLALATLVAALEFVRAHARRGPRRDR